MARLRISAIVARVVLCPNEQSCRGSSQMARNVRQEAVVSGEMFRGRCYSQGVVCYPWFVPTSRSSLSSSALLALRMLESIGARGLERPPHGGLVDVKVVRRQVLWSVSGRALALRLPFLRLPFRLSGRLGSQVIVQERGRRVPPPVPRPALDLLGPVDLLGPGAAHLVGLVAGSPVHLDVEGTPALSSAVHGPVELGRRRRGRRGLVPAGKQGSHGSHSRAYRPCSCVRARVYAALVV